MTERHKPDSQSAGNADEEIIPSIPWRPTAKALTYYLRVATWFATPLVYGWLGPSLAGFLLVTFLLCTIGADLVAGQTWWAPARPLPLGFMAFYPLACAAQWLYMGQFDSTLLLLITLLVFSIGSDVIAVASRGRFLVMTMLLVAFETRTVMAHRAGLDLLELFWPSAAIGSISRAFWPSDASGLMRTSLDFRLGRVEIISWGMKKVIAVGLRRL